MTRFGEPKFKLNRDPMLRWVTTALLVLPAFLAACHPAGSGDADMVAKREEFARFGSSAARRLEAVLHLKGKVVIVEVHTDGSISLDRFVTIGSKVLFDTMPVSPNPHSSGRYLPSDVYARKPDEVGTLIRLTWFVKVGSAAYTPSWAPLGSPGTLNVYSNLFCEVDVFDYEDRTLIGHYEVGADRAPAVISSGGSSQRSATLDEVFKLINGLGAK